MKAEGRKEVHADCRQRKGVSSSKGSRQKSIGGMSCRELGQCLCNVGRVVYAEGAQVKHKIKQSVFEKKISRYMSRGF